MHLDQVPLFQGLYHQLDNLEEYLKWCDQCLTQVGQLQVIRDPVQIDQSLEALAEIYQQHYKVRDQAQIDQSLQVAEC